MHFFIYTFAIRQPYRAIVFILTNICLTAISRPLNENILSKLSLKFYSSESVITVILSLFGEGQGSRKWCMLDSKTLPVRSGYKQTAIDETVSKSIISSYVM